MTFQARYASDGSIAGVSLTGGEFEYEGEWAAALIENAEPSYLKVDGDTLTLTVDEGIATYQILGPGRSPGTVLTRLISVARAEQ